MQDGSMAGGWCLVSAGLQEVHELYRYFGEGTGSCPRGLRFPASHPHMSGSVAGVCLGN